jgi:putative Holliday junction resolvase
MNRPSSVEDLAPRLPAKGRLIGLDLGTKTIGLAVSDVERRVASPLRTLARGAFQKDAAALVSIFSEFEIAGIILGLPLNLEGGAGTRTQSTRAFARNLASRTDLPIAYWDERFSTAVVTRWLIENDVSRTRRAKVVDKLAAAYILQGALDRLASIARRQGLS